MDIMLERRWLVPDTINMITHSLTLRNIIATLMLGMVLFLSSGITAFAQIDGGVDIMGGVTGAPTPPTESSLQDPGGCSMWTFNFTDCIAEKISLWSSSLMLSFGGSILRLSASIFDFGVNHVIIDFKGTLQDQLRLMPIIDAGWTFFRDLSNILIIGIFVFIAISLILGLKEYGQKKLVARVLIIAVLMNFSMLFTKIIIDASNFIAYSIYTQTAGAGSTGGQPRTFSIADEILKPLHVMGVWDTSALARSVYSQSGGPEGADKAFIFGLFGFLILTILAAVIFYGAFLIVARAIMLIILMLTAPIAYATYLAPHFEASEFGWSNWWKSLINNAAFAPLLMVFLSISILIMQTAAPQANLPLGTYLADPTSTRVITDGWRILFVYILGTGLLFTSFRLSSSLAGSISGVRFGQMAAGIPLAMGFAGAAKAAQYTLGRGLSKVADNRAVAAQQMHMQALNSGKAEDFARAEKLRKQKDMLEKGARSSFNLMNTSVGKGLTGGLGGILGGQTKGNFKDDMHNRAVAAEDKAKAAQVSAKDKDSIRSEAQKAELKNQATSLETAAKNLETAKAQLDSARTEAASADDPKMKQQAVEQTEKNRTDKAKDLDAAKEQVKVVEQKRTEIQSNNDAEIKTLMKQAEGMSGEAHDEQIRKIEARKAEQSTELGKQTEHIKAAHEKVKTIVDEIEQPTRVLEERQRKAREEIETREKEVRIKQSEYSSITTTIKKTAKEKSDTIIERAENHSKEEVGRIATKQAGIFGGSTGAHEIQHHFDEKFKKKSGAESVADAHKGFKADNGGKADDAAH